MKLKTFASNYLKPNAVITIENLRVGIVHEGLAKEIPNEYGDCEIVNISGLGSMNDLIITIR